MSAQGGLPKMTVVIPTYQQGHFIGRTIESIVSQNYPDLELILMDGGSSDDTMAIVERYRPHFSKIISQKDDGQADAIKRGFDMATGDIMAWCNSDDTYVPGSLLKVGAFFRDHREAQFVYGNNNIIDANDDLMVYKAQPDFNLGVMLYAYLTVPSVSAFWTRDLYQRAGGVDASFRFGMDYDLFVRMARLSAPIHSQIVIGNFRIHGDSKTSTLETVRQAEDQRIKTAYCAFGPDKPLMHRVVTTWYKGVLVWLCFKNGSLWDRLRGRWQNNFKSVCS
ncbi:MAG: glycosyltransferase family 2 protein [Beijerinckiaceae bacterium]